MRHNIEVVVASDAAVEEAAARRWQIEDDGEPLPDPARLARLYPRDVFRIFGYRGSMDFTIYPDTWIRDLPLLDFGEGADDATASGA